MALFPSPRIRLHEVLERGRPHTTILDVYEDGAQVVPTSAFFNLINSDGTDQIPYSAATVHPATGAISYDIIASQIPDTLSFSDSYLIHWKVLISGVEYIFRRSCALARSRLFPVISDIDLLTHYSDLNNIRPSSLTSWQNYITEAFIEIINRLRSEGNFEYLIMSNHVLREPHLHSTFALIFRDMDSSGLGEGRYLELAKEHRRAYESSFKRLRFKYDLDQDGNLDESGLRPGKGVIYTCNPPPYWMGPRY